MVDLMGAAMGALAALQPEKAEDVEQG